MRTYITVYAEVEKQIAVKSNSFYLSFFLIILIGFQYVNAASCSVSLVVSSHEIYIVSTMHCLSIVYPNPDPNPNLI